MGGENWSITAKLCDSCKTTSANLFCRPDSAFLCLACDAKIHAANKLASRHPRVPICDVCDQAPAALTCKADAASLCLSCDRDIHSANPLASRHDRFPVVPFYDSAAASKSAVRGGAAAAAEDRYFGEAEEAEAASWLLPNPNPNPNPSNKMGESGDLKATDYLFNDLEPSSYLDINVESADDKLDHHHQHQHQHQYSSDGVVPDECKNGDEPKSTVVDGFPAYGLDYSGSKRFMYNFNSQSISQSLSSSSLEVGVVPDHGSLTEVSNSIPAEAGPSPITGMDREARVLRYREKRKNRKFEKTIRYASRKAYAETRPRIKGRFAKRTETDVAADASYGVVPSY
jgi:hypothetical protein